MPLVCSSCHLNFCLSHRHPQDHACEGPQAVNKKRLEHFAGSSSSGRAPATVSAAPSGQQSKITNFFRGNTSSGTSSSSAPRAAAAATLMNGMTEDEALAAALAASMQESGPGAAAAAAQPHHRMTQVREEIGVGNPNTELFVPDPSKIEKKCEK